MPAQATLDDVAAAAGVHPSTVSRTLSRPDLVNPQTRERVRVVVDLLGYVANRAARQLAGGQTSTIAVLVPDITNPFFSGILRAAQRRASRPNRLVLLADTGFGASDELDTVRSLAPHVDGLIVCAPVAPTGLLQSAARKPPLVFVNRRAHGVGTVSVDQGLIVALALDHLRALGHTQIAVVRGPSAYWSSAERSRRLDEREDRSPRGRVIRLGPFAPTFEGGRDSYSAVRRARATAVTAFNDVMALGLIAAATDDGRPVPEHLSVIGSDGVPFAAMTTPGLTTVAAPVDTLGETAVDALDDLIAGHPPEQHTVPPELVIRRSTAPPGG